jgi:NTE family protein
MFHTPIPHEVCIAARARARAPWLARRLGGCLAGLLAAWLAAGAASAQPAISPSDGSTPAGSRPSAATVSAGPATRAGSPPGAAAPRPRIGLVLSGGGARGLAHVGVLKVLERAGVRPDVVVGTSMGSIIGGLYASGMRAGDIERELLAVDWSSVFSQRVGRRELPERRKDQDIEISAAFEFGWRDGELRLPQSAVSSRGLESLLRRYALPVRLIERFDDLPIPFRAVATDMETGQAVELDSGDLAMALRSSMSVPGVFSPVEHQGRILGDGGLVNNLPVDLARRLGADIVIAVNVGTPVGGRETLGSVIGLTAQMINILTEQNVQRSLALLRPEDVLVRPTLEGLGSGDFARTADFIRLGEAAAAAELSRLTALAAVSSPPASWGDRPAAAATPSRPALAFVEVEGTQLADLERLRKQLRSAPGQPFDAGVAEQDVRRLAASGDFLRTDYQLVRRAGRDGLVFELEDKPWGPHFLRVGLDLATDFAGSSGFNIKIAHDRHWLTPNGTEWRNRLHLGESPFLGTELYHPLRWREEVAQDWFVSGRAYTGFRVLSLFDRQGQEAATFNRTQGGLGVDIGRAFGSWGEVRLGPSLTVQRTTPRILSISGVRSALGEVRYEAGLRLRAVSDQLDYAIFPQDGYRAEAELTVGQRRLGSTSDEMYRISAEGTWVQTVGRHTLNLYARSALSDESPNPLVGRFTLGGFHNLSGYAPEQVNGNHMLLLRATWYMRLNQQVALTRGFFFGGTLESGNAWLQRGEVSLRDLRLGSSLFVGADTGLGPMYLGLTYAPGGSPGLVFFIGRP